MKIYRLDSMKIIEAGLGRYAVNQGSRTDTE